jgi:hypothetical protein
MSARSKIGFWEDNSQFTWMGSFEDLREGDHPEAIKIRNEFRDEFSDARSSGTGLIDQNEADAFAEFLSSYGI